MFILQSCHIPVDKDPFFVKRNNFIETIAFYFEMALMKVPQFVNVLEGSLQFNYEISGNTV